jgi:hypothetical protein
MLMGIIKTEDGTIVNTQYGPEAAVEGVTIKFSAICDANITCNLDNSLTDAQGQFNQCNHSPCLPCAKYKITPEMDQDPKNGVTTFDLLLISKHILNLEPLTSPYKIIAADANKSNTITTFDIVTLRKLILGVTSSLAPDNTSWRFVDRSYVFPNPFNPFGGFPEFRESEITSIIPADFVGVKIGDINLSALANNRPLERLVTSFGWSDVQRQTTKHITIPVQYFGLDPLSACQIGLQFDPNKLRLLASSNADIEGVGPDNFGLTEVENGKIRFVWLAPQLDPELMLMSGQTAFNLTFEILRDLPEDGSFPLAFDDNVLDNAVWNEQDVEYHIEPATDVEERQSVSSNVTSVVQVICTPNPTKGLFELTITPQTSGKARVGLFDNNGRMIQMMNTELILGQQQTIVLNGLEKEPSGVYIWKVFNSAFKEQGQIIKQ